jgi:hypothetical protein
VALTTTSSMDGAALPCGMTRVVTVLKNVPVPSGGSWLTTVPLSSTAR